MLVSNLNVAKVSEPLILIKRTKTKIKRTSLKWLRMCHAWLDRNLNFHSLIISSKFWVVQKVLESFKNLICLFEAPLSSKRTKIPVKRTKFSKIYHCTDQWMWALKTLHINTSKNVFVTSNIVSVSTNIIHLPQVVVTNLRGQNLTLRGRLFDKSWFFKIVSKSIIPNFDAESHLTRDLNQNQLFRILMLKAISLETWIFTL